MSSPGLASVWVSHCGGLQHARLVGVSEEGDRRLGADQHEVARLGEGRYGGVDRVREEVDSDTPRPRSTLALSVCARRRAPLFAAMRPASIRPGSRRAWPPINKTAGSPERKTRAASEIASGATCARPSTGGSGAGPSASFQEASAGRIRVATRPGGAIAAATASAPSRATERLSAAVRTQSEKGRHTLDVRGKRRFVLLVVGCVVADDVDHRRVGAPGVMHVGEPVGESWPKCRRVEAGLSAMRA